MKIRCLEEKLSMFEAKVIRLERSVTDLVIKLDTFMCMENSGDDSIDKVIDVTEDVIETVAPLKHQDKFGCHLCDFASNRQNGLVIHMGRKHKKDISNPIGQFDGNATNDDEIIDDTDDLLYEYTENYWKRGWLGTVYQNYLDALKIIDESSINEVEKKAENEAILAARKEAFGDRYRCYPPWDSTPWF